MPRSQLLLAASLASIATIGGWGVLDPESLVEIATRIVDRYFESRGWFVMLTVSGMLLLCIWLAFSRYGEIRLGADDDRPEYSTPTWLAMLFAAGMGVGLLFWAVAEPLTHYAFGASLMAHLSLPNRRFKPQTFIGAFMLGRSTGRQPWPSPISRSDAVLQCW